MRFLTREWHSGDLSDTHADALEAAYGAHLGQILPLVPKHIREFQTDVSVHDGLVQTVVLDHRDATLHMVLRCGDQQRGYQDVAMTYRDVDLALLDVALLALIVDDVASEALYLELDQSDDLRLVHRWLWWPFRRELDITFRDLRITLHPQSNRNIERPLNAFTEIRAHAV